MPDTTLPALAGSTSLSQSFRTPAFMVPDSYQAIEKLAEKLCAAEWVPKSYIVNGKPSQAKVEVAIMHGLDIGLPPLAAVQNIAVINGMPSVWGDAMMALVEASGLLEDASEVYEGQGDEMAAVCTYKRRGRPTPIVGRFSMAMAKRAGLLGKAGPWTQYTARMLKLRARAFGLRDGFADVLKGIHMAEEVIDGGDFIAGSDGVFVPAERPTRARIAQAMSAEADAIPFTDIPEPREIETETSPSFAFLGADGEEREFGTPAAAKAEFVAHLREVYGGDPAAAGTVYDDNGPFLTALKEAGEIVPPRPEPPKASAVSAPTETPALTTLRTQLAALQDQAAYYAWYQSPTTKALEKQLPASERAPWSAALSERFKALPATGNDQQSLV
ncbi:hypothetical protein VPG91_11690 [Nitrospirillum amazonense]|uniref:hypothetical protein n=1 Tax=Nitrospirillum amazonense TaxID=28077 RepID=UPI002DD4432F|nr:hypothetical protein [Nitrospirillum amazonense]MEC4591652.1 hypothetical protein [Nitrospirillum amazonense]